MPRTAEAETPLPSAVSDVSTSSASRRFEEESLAMICSTLVMVSRSEKLSASCSSVSGTCSLGRGFWDGESAPAAAALGGPWPPVKVTRLQSSHVRFVFFSGGFMVGSCQPPPSSFGSTKPTICSPYVCARSCIWKKLTRSPGCAYLAAGMHAMLTPPGASSSSRMCFTPRSSETMARIFDTMSFDCRKSDTFAIASFSRIVR
mmetsp:Transcript_28874/g.94385  ORF Transcript_28874/g.94385 Transcript_28874/m.94385 type:complete len:203 (-) Transcript_28874:1975-2583(-)